MNGINASRITFVRRAIALHERAGFIRFPDYSPYVQWDLSYRYAKPL